MTQNARLALWVPTADDAIPGEIIEVRSVPGAGRVIQTEFDAQAGATGGIGDAPIDGKFYARKDAGWSESVGEAPQNGALYGRKNAAWSAVPPFPEAPVDGQQYARQNAAWSVIVGLPAVIDGGTY